MSTHRDSWNLTEGDRIGPGLSAIRLLGGGHAYEAWLAFDEVTWLPVVVKVLRPGQVDDESSRRGLRREVLALRELNHPVVVRGLRADQEGVRPHVVLEQVDGPRLSTLIRRYGRLQEQQYLPLACDIAAALHFFTVKGWTHLDIKPSNVIMGAPARLIDLSVARPVGDARELRYPIGTDAYMAPEQCDPGHGSHVPDFASDVWGLGATLFHAVAGERPFEDGDPHADDVVGRFPQLGSGPRALPDGLHPVVAEVIGACLDANPGQRPAPHEISDALGPVYASLPRGSLSAFKIRR
jgi:serine/threonine protein kinase